MKERPILFSAPMIKAILAGTKTQTRRIVKWNSRRAEAQNGYVLLPLEDGTLWPAYRADGCERFIESPYGEPGDRLWARETWRVYSMSGCFDVYYRATGTARAVPPEHHDKAAAAQRNGAGGLTVPWRPSIFMPRWASRITLEVTSVRVERLQSITEEDARAEGVECRSDLAWDEAVGSPDPYASAVERGHRAAFRDLWDKINGKRATWASDPWVWVVGFKRCEP